MTVTKIGLSVLLFTFFRGITNLKDVHVIIPPAVKSTDTVTLKCNFNLEGEELYVVKWYYKGSKEFFRFIPKEMPPVQIFYIEGITVDVSKSDASQIVLKDVQPEISGKYKCTVDTDHPNFYSLAAAGYMYVIDIPTDEPLLEFEVCKEPETDIFRGNCSSPPVLPSANISWLINGKKIPPSYQNVVLLKQTNRSALYTTQSILEFELPDSVYRHGKLVISCVVSIFNLYEKQKMITLEPEKPKIKSALVLATYIYSGVLVQKIVLIFYISLQISLLLVR